jgi:nitroreductase
VDALEAIFGRRSTGRLVAPAPDGDEVELLLLAGAAAPDHGCLRPFRFVVLQAESKDRLGQVLASAYLARCESINAAPDPDALEKERTKLGRAPLVIVVAAERQETRKIPWEEQENAAAAAAQNILLAATALGYGSMWRTGEPAYDAIVKRALQLDPDDAIVGFLYIGTAPREPDRRTPDLDGLVIDWN